MIFETKRLILKAPSVDDVAVMSSILNDLKTMQHLSAATKYGNEWTYEKTLSRINNQIDLINKREGIFFHIFHKQDNRLIGVTGFPQLDLNNKIATSGMILSHQYWGNKYAVEAFLPLFEYGFEVLHIEVVKFYTMKSNTLIQGFFKKFGISFESDNDGSAKKMDYSTIGELIYSLDSANWPKVKDRLLNYLNY